MPVCPECGIEIGEGDAVIGVEDVLFHPDCVRPPYREPESRERRHAKTARAAARLRFVGAVLPDPESLEEL